MLPVLLPALVGVVIDESSDLYCLLRFSDGQPLISGEAASGDLCTLGLGIVAYNDGKGGNGDICWEEGYTWDLWGVFGQMGELKDMMGEFV
jgi:hypothetical protein